MNKNWKYFERKVAKIFNTQRNALSGSNSKITSSDTLHKTLYIEVKSNIKYPSEAKKYDFIFFIDKEYYFLLKLKQLKDLNFKDKYSILCYHKHSLLNLIKDIENKAMLENKIPLLVFKEKNKHDIYLLFRFRDIGKIREELC